MDLADRRTQAARCMDCGVPFCQTGMMLGGMVTGCPLNNLIPEWNDMLYRGSMPYALSRALKNQQLSGVHRPRVPRALRGGVYLSRCTATRSRSAKTNWPSSSTRLGTA